MGPDEIPVPIRDVNFVVRQMAQAGPMGIIVIVLLAAGLWLGKTMTDRLMHHLDVVDAAMQDYSKGLNQTASAIEAMIIEAKSGRDTAVRELKAELQTTSRCRKGDR